MIIEVEQFNKLLGDILREKREDKDIGIIKYSYEVGISHTFVNRVEKGRSKISLYELFKYCEGLDIKPSEIVRLLEESIESDE